MSLIGAFTKQPAEVESYTVDYSEDLTAGDNIESTVIDVDPAGSLVVTSSSVIDPRVRVWLRGGDDGDVYKVTVTTSTADGRVLQDEFRIKIKDY